MNMNTIQIWLRAALCIAVCAALGGCLSSTPHWDKTFGNSVTQIRDMQVLNPNAGDNTDPVAGIDGKAAVAAQTQYDKSFTAPPPSVNVFTIGVSPGTTN
jgi:hypothetical protein